jgi:hypothetical protein
MLSQAFFSVFLATALFGQISKSQVSTEQLPILTPGRTAAQNALWLENDLKTRFNSSKRIVVADIAGPATITMIHFAFPASGRVNRDLLLKIYWDGEKEPSVECPMVDFFCDPAGMRDEVNTALVNKRRGWNAYFPLPFRKSARIELVYEGSTAAGKELWNEMPCYSYVMYRTLDKVPEDAGYFHASWRQETLLLGKRDYVALEAKGNGKFIGWNVTVRQLDGKGYPVDENEKFYIDGEETPSVEFQGLEDSFGFSWGFPESQSQFPLTGYYPFFQGAAAYRFFMQDAIRFEKSLRVTIGFGKNENPHFRKQFSKQGSEIQFSSVAYWYQTEPHEPLPKLPSAEERYSGMPEDALPTPESLKKRGVKLLMLCGRPHREVIFAEPGFAAVAKAGYAYNGWNRPVYHCRASDKTVEIEVTTPKNTAGTLRLYLIDLDHFFGGRKQTVTVAGKSLGTIENFDQGRWLEQPLTAAETAAGKISIQVSNAREGSNAVISMVEWVQNAKGDGDK